MKDIITNSTLHSKVNDELTEKDKEIIRDDELNNKNNPFTIVAIGASAGGLEAVMILLKNLSPTTGMAYIYVQHLSPDRKSMLSTILQNHTQMPVQEIDDMEKIEPNNFYIIPHDKEIAVVDGHIKLLPRPTKRTANLSIDLLFSSLAVTHKENVIGIVLSGSASDGTEGLKEIKQAGGITFAQDDSAKFTSMPRSAIATNVVDFVLSPADIAQELLRISESPFLKSSKTIVTPEEEIDNNDPDLKYILELLFKAKNVDFTNYKMNTIKRRILRRMLIRKIKSINEYSRVLSNEKELDILFQDLLINVTEFFRDLDAFIVLKKAILPNILKSKMQGETIRIWVAACATGEEVYSIAMTLIELQQNSSVLIPFQIFASDLSADAIAVGRHGEYTANQLKNVSPRRLQQFFIKNNDKYKISKQLRDMCVFAQHNILNDPPFSRMDFISCRNFLIYLDSNAQKKAIATFHYALNDGGCLFLGKSETIGNSTQLFTISNKKCKFYIRKKNSGNMRIPETPTRFAQAVVTDTKTLQTMQRKPKPQVQRSFGEAFDAILLEKYVPASVVINHDLEILQFRGKTSLFLENSTGKASFNIMKMANIEINFELRNAIHNAIKTKRIVKKTNIEMNREVDGKVIRVINIEVVPLNVEGNEPLLIIIFTGIAEELTEIQTKFTSNSSVAKDRRIKKLEEEIAAARADMNTISRDQEAVNEELQSANEEVISSNEELQSLNEELETSKEEIESTNEELITSNQELHARIQQVEELYNYYETIIGAVHEPVLILDKNIRIKSANKSFCKRFHLIEEDIIGVSLYRICSNKWNIPALREQLEDVILKNNRFHDFEVEQNFPVLGHRTMLLNAHCILQQSQNEELIVLTIIDITEVKQLAIALEQKNSAALAQQLSDEKNLLKTIEDSNKRYNMLLMKSPFAFAIMTGANMVLTLANDSIKEFWGKGEDIEGKTFLEIFPELENSEFPALLQDVFSTGVPFVGTEFPVEIIRNGTAQTMYYNFCYQPYYEADETITGVTIISTDVTQQVFIKNEFLNAKNEAEIKTKIAEDAMQAKQQFLSNMSHEIRTPMNAIIGFTNVILKTELSKEQQQYLDAIKVSGDALVILINDILDLAKVDSGKMTFESVPFNLLESIDGIVQLFEIKMNEKNLQFELITDSAIPAIIWGDPMRLRQIILNLISNAVKFTEFGKITVSVYLLSSIRKNISLEFAVTDTGIGIAEDKLEFIFNDFEQAHSETHISYGGTGLGLAIVKKLVEHQGGTITAKSVFGAGSTFSFTLEFSNKGRADHIVHKTTNGNLIGQDNEILQNIKILVAEDVLLNQLLIKIILADFNFEVDIAENGKIALEKMQANSYDLILMDLHMPEMNGFETAIIIRNEMKSQIPIIALTADVTKIDIDKCMEVGMNDYISKPIDEVLLYSKINDVLKKSK